MAERGAEQPAELLPPGQQEEGSDDESVASNEPINPQQLSRFESELKDEMSSIASQVKETVLGMNQQMERKFSQLDRQIHGIEMHLRDQNNNQGISQIRNSTPLQLNTDGGLPTSNLPMTQSAAGTENAISQFAPSRVEFNLPGTNSNTEVSASTSNTRAEYSVKLKPQNFAGTNDDFEDFLTQFEITAEKNGWNYRAKSLYLANSLTGAARALLNELNDIQRRDFRSLVQKLKERFGSENRAEVFRSQLKSRSKGKGETTAELAQAIRKLTRQAYPQVSLDVVEALSIDHFIEALPESEIRLRLREVGPSTLAEAERIAVRMDAHRQADKQRTRFVGKVDQSEQNKGSRENSTEQQMDIISKRMDSLSRSVQDLSNQQRIHAPVYPRNFQNNNSYQRPNRPDFRYMPPQRNFQPRGGNPRFNQQHQAPAQFFRNQPRPQENFRQPVQGPRARLN